LRKVRFVPGYLRHAEGSCLVEAGNTVVLCAATLAEGIPAWRRGTGAGWVTAEYGMLPRSGFERTPRTGAPSGRAVEIQRMIGRALRCAIDLGSLGERTIVVDCDVIEADGGTRTAAINGGMVALNLATLFLVRRGLVPRDPIRRLVTAVSVGIVEASRVLDLSYEEDARAEVDLNLVMTSDEEIVEVQGAAEGVPFSQKELGEMLRLGRRGIRRILRRQRRALEPASEAR
jgi:ribonuclease PH